MKFLKTYAAVAIAISAMQTHAAESITFKGSVRTELPKVTSTQTAVPVSNVKDYKLSLGSDAGICELTTDDTYAKRTVNSKGKWICLVEWDAERYGLAPVSLDLAGLLNSNGELNFGYKLSIYSEGQKYEITTSSIASTVQAPVAPVVKDFSVRWAKRNTQSTGSEHWNFERSNALVETTVIVEPRPFPQKVELNGQSCNVAENATGCAIRVQKDFIGEPLKQGQLAYDGLAKDTKGFFTAQAPSNVKINWDFREPEIKHLAINNKNDGTDLPVSFDGVDLTLGKDQAVVFVKSPHIGRQDEWWKPKDMTLALDMASGLKHSDLDDIGGTLVRYNIKNMSSTSNFRIKPLTDVTTSNGYLVYKYDLNTVPDGKYGITVRAEDIYANKSDLSQPDTLIDRFGPDIKLLNSKTVVGTSKMDLYFTKDLTIAANGGYADGTTIKSIKWNGIDTTFTGDSARIKVPAHQEFSVDTDLQLEVTAEDGAGNQTVKTFDFRYMPVDFELAGVPDSIYRGVESTQMRLGQTKGIKCKTASSDELAQLQARGIYKGCTVEWDQLPAGLESITYPTSFALQGGIDTTGDTEWGYKVYFHDKEGNKALAKSGTAKVTVNDAPAPDFQLSTLNKLEDGVYGISHNSNQITRYMLQTVPADNILHVTSSNGEIDKEIFLKQRLTKKAYSIRNALKRPVVEGKMAWDKTTYTVDAFHRRVPESKTTTTFDLITFPDGGVRAKLSLEETETTNAQVVNASVQLGRQKGSSLIYDIPKMGRWKSYLAIRQNGQYLAITDPVDIDDQGRASFVLNANDVYLKTNAIYAVAEALSPFEKYKRTVVSTSARLNVLQSEAIDGLLTSRTTRGKVPFSSAMIFNYEDKQDRAAAEPVGWETSLDGSDWADLGVKAGQKMYSARITEVGVQFYRVKMKNRLTGEISYTDPLRIVGYETPEIWIDGADSVYAGAKTTLTVYSDETADIAEDGFAEWSVDGGVTWESGDTVKEFTVAQNMKILARYRLNSTDDEVGEEGYIQASHRITAVPLAPVRISVSGPKSAEVGTTIKLTAKAAHSNSTITDKLVSYWTTPGGERIDGTDIEYTVKDTDVQDGQLANFVFTAYAENFESQTKATGTVSTTVWQYNMPEVGLTLMSRIQIAPATIVARVDTPYFYAPGVELKYEWILPAGVEVARESSSLTYLTATTPGVHKIGIQVSDNRGNTKDVFQFIDVVEADPLAMGVEVRPSNVFERAPVSYSVRTNAKPGHPNDSMKSYAWLLDGAELAGQTKPYATVAIQNPGTYNLSVKFKTEYGQEGELQQVLTVVPNKPPVCEPTVTESASSVTVASNCKDTDGKIISIKYTWRDDGYESSGGTKLRFTKSLHDSLNVRIRATDDSGAETVSEVQWTKTAPASQ
jgi:hypothetical protein